MRSLIVSAAFLLTVLWESRVRCDLSPGGGDVSDSIPLLASGKRQHNIMRFGKRPASGHSLIHFGKRDEPSSNKGHSFLYFGKRSEGDSSIWDYLGPNRDPSYKRGHAIMRFGKRGLPNTASSPASQQNMLHFSRSSLDSEGNDEEEKRSNGHSMMYFGKRGNGHSMLYFGKRDDVPDDYENNFEDKRSHAMIHFGKRVDDDGAWEGKRAHAMIHFGKRGSEVPSKSGSHTMIHFGKRDLDDDFGDIEAAEQSYWTPAMIEAKRQHNLLRFGKKDRKGSHAMIHFGKRDVDESKRAHTMIHFGKRSADDALQADQSNKGLSRVKREIGHPQGSDMKIALVPYADPEEDIMSSQETLTDPEIWNPLEQQPYEEEWDPSYREYSNPDKKEGSKNVFLRFG